MKEDNKILILTSCFPDSDAARANKLEYRCNKLIEEGYDVEVIVPGFSFREEKLKLDKGPITVYRPKDISYNYIVKLGRFIGKYSLSNVIDCVLPVFYSENNIPNTAKMFTTALEVENLLEDIDIVNTQSYPFVNNIILSLLTSEESSHKWIMEYRDPWLNNVYLMPNNPSKTVKKWERKALEKCTKLIWYDGIHLDGSYFIKEYPQYTSKIVNIGHFGFNQTIMNRSNPKEFDKFTIVYSGTFYGKGQSPDNFFEAFSNFVEEKNISAEELQILFLGTDKKYGEKSDKLGVSDYVEFTGWKEYEECLSYIKGADLALYINGDVDKLNVSSKMSDYIGARTPVLCLSEEGWESWKLVEDEEIGYVAERKNKESVKEELEKAWERQEFNFDDIWEDFNRETSLEEYLRVLESSS